MWKRLEVVANISLAIAALAFTSIFLWREMHGGQRGEQDAPTSQTLVGPWKYILADSVAHRRGIRGGVEIVEFVDLECPFCARHNLALEEFFRGDSGRISYTFVHRPLKMHRFALPAARAAECAGDQSRFFEFVEVVFRKQDSLGLKSWSSYSLDAGIRDTATFSTCLATRRQFRRIDRGIEFAESLGISSTPTLLVDGYKIVPVPSAERFATMLDSLGRSKSRQPD